MTEWSSLAGKRVLVTGVGMKPVKHVFHDITTGQPSHDSVWFGNKEYKVNIGAATALECVRAGARVCLLSRSATNLARIRKWILDNTPCGVFRNEEMPIYERVESIVADMNDPSQTGPLLSAYASSNERPLYWVQCVGLGAGTVQLADDNPYLRIENVTKELLDAEHSVLTNTVSTLQLLLPFFRKQKETRICIVSSMSAIRSVVSGSAHNASKGALSRFANAAMIELHPDRIFITDVRPGGVDTGLYDSKVVQKTITEICRTYDVDWSQKNGGLRLAPPSSVGKAIVMALASEAHITSLNMVSRGQFPHEGS
ncbi:MAG: SDR family oxidoreductase [bacterium]|nr:SDR family oxidoreductase [bacterium]